MEKWKGNDVIFKGYLEGNWKKPKKSTRDKDNYIDFDTASKCGCFGGVLNDGFIDISFDSKDMYNAFLKMCKQSGWRCLCLPSKNGGHSYWRNSGRIAKGGESLTLAVGLVADMHHKGTYIPLKVSGINPKDASDVRSEKRFPPDYDILEGEDYQEVPEELLPVKTREKLWQMGEGDGRNGSLYSYILTLQSQLSLDNDTIRRILNNTSDFVFSAPLGRNELETIMRDEAFQKPIFFEDKKFKFDRFAEYMKNVCHAVLVNGQLHIYKDGIYRNGYREIESQMIQYMPDLSDARRKEIMKYMNLICKELKPADARYIACHNGIYDVIDDKLRDFTPDIVVTNKIPWDYNPYAFSALADKTLDKLACKDREIRLLLEECIGYCMYRRNELGKAFICTGDKANGKSTFLDLVHAVLGDDNVSALDLKELGDRFNTSMMFGKLANIGDDIGDDFLQGAQVSIFKKIVTGNRIKAERKGQEPFEFNPYIKLLFSANDIPRMKDKTGAVLRRLVIIPFNATFSKSDPDYDPFIKYKLVTRESLEYLIMLGLDGLKRVLENQGFTKSEKVESQIREYEEENNPIISFITEFGEQSIVNNAVGEVYRMYTVFCADNSMNPMASNVFSKQVNKRLNLESVTTRINGKVTRVFIKAKRQGET